MLRLKVIILAMAILLAGAYAEAAGRTIKLIIDNKPVVADPGPIMSDGRVFVPIRFVADELGAGVQWDEQNNAVIISRQQGVSYLKGHNHAPDGAAAGIMSNLIRTADLKNMLDDDGDGDLADFRQGHSSGDDITNDPLVVDIRKQADYDAGHIPGAIWMAGAENMAEEDNVEKLNIILSEHVKSGGQKEIVLYCNTGNTSGLVAGVLGAKGLPVKSMMYGFDIAWSGTKSADSAIRANMEDSGGNTIECGG